METSTFRPSAHGRWRCSYSGGRLQLIIEAPDWIAKSEALPFLHFVPVDNRIAMRSVESPECLHRDPADRIIVSTAINLGVPLVTADERLQNYPHVKTVWE